MDKNKVDEYLNESLLVAKKQIEMIDEFMVIAEQITNKMKNGGTIFFCGNGGSAADSQHLAAELIGRFKKDRKPLKALALTTDTSVITSNANDIGYETIFQDKLVLWLKKTYL